MTNTQNSANVFTAKSATEFLARQPQEAEAMLEFAKITKNKDLEEEVETALAVFAAKALAKSPSRSPEEERELEELMLSQSLDMNDGRKCYSEVFFGNFDGENFDFDPADIVSACEELNDRCTDHAIDVAENVLRMHH